MKLKQLRVSSEAPGLIQAERRRTESAATRHEVGQIYNSRRFTKEDACSPPIR